MTSPLNREELQKLKKTFESRALTVLTKGGERYAYGWKWEDLKPYIEQYAQQVAIEKLRNIRKIADSEGRIWVEAIDDQIEKERNR